MAVEKTVFISYRRTNVYMARAVYQHLTAHGFDCFLDYQSIDAGSFERIILNQIAARAHFILILTPSALERCVEPGDWLRREIERALDLERSIISLLFEGFSFRAAEKVLVDRLAALPQYGALEVQAAAFEEAMRRLREDYLSQYLNVTLQPTPEADQSDIAIAQASEAAQPAVKETQLTAGYWLEQGYQLSAAGKLEAAISAYSEAIRLNPAYAEAYRKRGMTRDIMGDETGALDDYNEAIRLNPTDPESYLSRGIAHYNKGDVELAIGDFNLAIRLNPAFTDAYVSRGIAYVEQNTFNRAMDDYNEAIRLNPACADAYRSRGIAYDKKQDLLRANADYQKYMEFGGAAAALAQQWISDNEAKMHEGK